MNAADILDGVVPFPTEGVDEACTAVANKLVKRLSESDEKNYGAFENFCATASREELGWPLESILAMVRAIHASPNKKELQERLVRAHYNYKAHGGSKIVFDFWRGQLGQAYIKWNIQEGDRWLRKQNIK